MTIPVILGCGGFGLVTQPVPTLPIEPTWTISPLPSPTFTDTVPPTFIPTDTPTASPTLTPTATPEPEFIFQGPGNVTVPILLYHHVGISQKESPYYIAPDEFDRQMNLLYEWGYRTITVDLLVEAILYGAELPAKPIILTFDDGSETVFTEAFPIMQNYGFIGTAYIVYNYVGVSLFMDRNQIRELYNAGWEIGSHGLSHVDLRKRQDRQKAEIVESRRKLQSLLEIPIFTFAYPYGSYDDLSLNFIAFAGYEAAVGLGPGMQQGPNNLYYLYRREIKKSYDLGTFAHFLPWQKELNALPASTAVP